MARDNTPTRVIDRTELDEALVAMALSILTDGRDDEPPTLRAQNAEAVLRAFAESEHIDYAVVR